MGWSCERACFCVKRHWGEQTFVAFLYCSQSNLKRKDQGVYLVVRMRLEGNENVRWFAVPSEMVTG